MSVRLDVALTENGTCESRTKAQELIKSGAVTVNGKTVTKPSFPVEISDSVNADTEGVCPFVSRGGLKLQAALDSFSLDVSGAVCIDIGASTGGFTDCLLKCGAVKVFAVDSGTSQLHPSLKADGRVICMENTNARYLTASDIGQDIDVAVMDVSFISQTKLYPAVASVLKNKGVLVSLIKPQFEVGKSGIGKGGIVKDAKLTDKTVKSVIDVASGYGLQCEGKIVSPIKGGDGNTEYLAIFRLNK